MTAYIPQKGKLQGQKPFLGCLKEDSCFLCLTVWATAGNAKRVGLIVQENGSGFFWRARSFPTLRSHNLNIYGRAWSLSSVLGPAQMHERS